MIEILRTQRFQTAAVFNREFAQRFVEALCEQVYMIKHPPGGCFSVRPLLLEFAQRIGSLLHQRLAFHHLFAPAHPRLRKAEQRHRLAKLFAHRIEPAPLSMRRLNNTLQEGWKTRADACLQWSHCAVAPLYIAHQGLAGIRPLEPGFARVELRPQLADLEDLELITHTVRGPLYFHARGKPGDRELTVELPAKCEGELVLRREEKVVLRQISGRVPSGHVRYRLPAGTTTALRLARS